MSEKTPIDAEQAREALKTINQSQQSAIAQAKPPARMGLIVALFGGIMVGLSVVGIRDYHVLLIVAMAVALAWQSQQVKVATDQYPWQLVAFGAVVGAVLYFVFIIAGQMVGTFLLGDAIGAILAGVGYALSLWGLSVHERRWYDKQGDA